PKAEEPPEGGSSLKFLVAKSEPDDCASVDDLHVLGLQLLGSFYLRFWIRSAVSTCATAGNISLKVPIAEVQSARRRIQVLRDAEAPHLDVGARHPKDVGNTWRRSGGRFEISTGVESTPVALHTIFAVEHGVTEAKVVLRDTGLHQPLLGVR